MFTENTDNMIKKKKKKIRGVLSAGVQGGVVVCCDLS